MNYEAAIHEATEAHDWDRRDQLIFARNEQAAREAWATADELRAETDRIRRELRYSSGVDVESLNTQLSDTLVKM